MCLSDSTGVTLITVSSSLANSMHAVHGLITGLCHIFKKVYVASLYSEMKVQFVAAGVLGELF